MSISFNRWPSELEDLYRRRGYWLDLPLNHILERHVTSEKIALICNMEEYSYRQLNTLVDNLALALTYRGIKQNQTALVHLGNVAEFYIVFFALLKIGVVPVNALFSHQRNELLAYCDQINPSLIIADRHHSLFSDNIFINELHQRYSTLKNVFLCHDNSQKNSLSYLINEKASKKLGSSHIELAFFQLSGGSTSTPKLIPRTHNDYYYSIRESVKICCFDHNTRYLCALPAAHNYPLSSPGALGVFYAGGVVIMADNPSVDICFPLIKKHLINVTSLVPPAVCLWLEAIKSKGNKSQLYSLKLLQVGGARLSESLARRIPNELGCKLQQVFGMSEGLVNYTRLDDEDDVIFSTQGRPISDDDEVLVVDENNNRLPAGVPGRLLTRGPYTIRGYYSSPEYNQRVFNDEGFYYSGDLVIQYENGYLKVVGREKDQINRGGEKIAAEEIENLLMQHPDIIYAALVAVSDELMGEKSCAYIMINKKVKASELRRYLRERGIAGYKIPDQFRILKKLPTTPVGKVDKKSLKLLSRNQFLL